MLYKRITLDLQAHLYLVYVKTKLQQGKQEWGTGLSGQTNAKRNVYQSLQISGLHANT